MGNNNYYEIDNFGRHLLNLHLLLFSIKQGKINIIKNYASNMNPLYFSLPFPSGCIDSRAEGQRCDWQDEQGAAAATDSRD